MMRKDKKPVRKRKPPAMLIVAETQLKKLEVLAWVTACSAMAAVVMSAATLALALWR